MSNRTKLELDSLTTADELKNVVGGVRLDRPFCIRRLGHFGISVDDVAACLPFYTDVLGFAVSDTLDFNQFFGLDENVVGPGIGYLLRHGAEHHSFALFPRRQMMAIAEPSADMLDITVNQITWQVGSLREVVDAFPWLAQQGLDIVRQGRDTPGSNWHCYPRGFDGNINELYYGIELIGWNGRSKPQEIYSLTNDELPKLPYVSEATEVQQAMAKGLDLNTGVFWKDREPANYDVGGILLSRPFKVTRVGPVRLFVKNMARAVHFYKDVLGLTLTEEIVWSGHSCYFLRANTEHHSIALYPIAIREELGLSPENTLMGFGLQVGDYAQLRDAVIYLKKRGATIRYLPQELFPGIDYSVLALDPSGHAVHLYYCMEQIGWDGKPCPNELRVKFDNENWPETVELRADTFRGEAFLGPLG
ncbi:VOC family protein [Glaciimonas sp. PCH181]|uniref:VOC family protein n=1 Tax=Glaciimonas sp. PCH181 TaxID=2133943 RepID=UPI000D3BF830|nr:VOC family protein [Glaciimonas sp. PCH181]PUA19487.1 extradiol dioxygenase [Glaciimonas sp. PCH181]